MSNITKVFQKAKANGTGALIGYIMAGDPTPRQTPKIADALIKGGVDILELGLPFSDPIADGPTIQAAGLRALNAGTTPAKVLEIAKQIKSQHDIPIVLMTYYNPVFRIGLEKFLSSAKECKVDGFIIPDLPVEEATDYKKTAKSFGLDTIFLVAPSTSMDRLPKIVDASSGFLYLVSHYGVTGIKTTVEDSTVKLIKSIQPCTSGKIPLAVGFGISKPEHVQQVVAAGADAAIVGSAFINIIQQNSPIMIKQLQTTVQSLKSAAKIQRNL
jgi:tryptophan synthase alpha chain